MMRHAFYEHWIQRRKLCAALAACIIIIAESSNTARPRRSLRRRVARRKGKGLHHNVSQEVSLKDPDRCGRCQQMDMETCENLPEDKSPLISMQDTHLRERTPAASTSPSSSSSADESAESDHYPISPPLRPASTSSDKAVEKRGVNQSAPVNEALKVLRQISSQPVVIPQQDSAEPFGRFVAARLRVLDPESRKRCEMEIMKVLTQYPI